MLVVAVTVLVLVMEIIITIMTTMEMKRDTEQAKHQSHNGDMRTAATAHTRRCR